ncbi:calcineurin-like phosphoesterase C-terminal domain-containing protein [Bacteroides ihuae]|uniref:calcineurin-like phosphoesterase C-terminal domain-containing protein n=1 Tax=Bacteroides ihuae TaxID=1852362 RepID=UPI0008D95169|nr:calcineurin-like phosphoesterase family protein [Bacteroides ihuae]
MRLRLLLLLWAFQWSVFTFNVQAALTPVYYYGEVVSEGKGIANVPVTDGTQIVLTDKKGQYSMLSTSAVEYIYITLPDKYDVPMKDKVPVFFQKVPAKFSKKVRLDFKLTPSSKDNKKHILIVWADPQVYFDEDMAQVRHASQDVKELLANNYPGIPAYGVVCGDIIGDINKKPSYFSPMIDAIHETGIPFFYVIGNHDLDLNVRSNEYARATYKSYFGPTYYSFNRGDVHYIVLDDVFFIGKSYLYVGYLTEQQLQWMEQDLRQVTPGSTVVVATHIPTYSREARQKEWGKESTMKVMNNRSHFYDLLKPYNAHIMSGHEHYNENYVLADNLYEHVHAPLSTLFWQAPWACDGTPGGYAVYEFDGGKVNWYYKCADKDKDYQFELYPVGASRNIKNAIVANIWNYDSTWKVRWYENSINRGEMTRFSGYDPAIYDYCDKYSSTFKHRYLGAGITEHLFYAVPQKKDSDIRVEVTDHCGNVYTQEMKQSKLIEQ